MAELIGTLYTVYWGAIVFFAVFASAMLGIAVRYAFLKA
jgi:hypothetical protein